MTKEERIKDCITALHYQYKALRSGANDTGKMTKAEWKVLIEETSKISFATIFSLHGQTGIELPPELATNLEKSDFKKEDLIASAEEHLQHIIIAGLLADQEIKERNEVKKQRRRSRRD